MAPASIRSNVVTILLHKACKIDLTSCKYNSQGSMAGTANYIRKALSCGDSLLSGAFNICFFKFKGVKYSRNS